MRIFEPSERTKVQIFVVLLLGGFLYTSYSYALELDVHLSATLRFVDASIYSARRTCGAAEDRRNRAGHDLM